MSSRPNRLECLDRSERLDPYALVGTVFRDRYAVESFVGVGRFSAIYRGTETATGLSVALRLLKVRSTLNPSERTVVVERLRSLTHAISDVASQCPAFAGVSEVGALVTAGRWMPLVVQTWMDGETLEWVHMKERSHDAPIRSVARAIDLLTPVADALGYAHARGLVHGSLAPRNLFVRDVARDGWHAIEILDLGLAQVLATLQAKDRAFADDPEGPMFFFAPAYGSPEHFRGNLDALSPASDVFALALITVEMVSGRSSLGDGDDDQLERASLDPACRPTPRAHGRDLGRYVEAVFERALALQATDRYASVSSFWEALRAASRMTTPRPLSRSSRPPPLPRMFEVAIPGTDAPPTFAFEPAPLSVVRARPRDIEMELSPPRSVRESAPPRSVRESSPPRSVRDSIPPEDFFETAFAPSSRDTFPSIPGTNPLFAGEPEAVPPSRRAKSP